jgi:monolysocardiolipin acyltransferase
MAPRWVQSATIASVGLVCKAFLHSRLCSVSVTGLSNLLHALEESQRKNDGRGVITGVFVISL